MYLSLDQQKTASFQPQNIIEFGFLKKEIAGYLSLTYVKCINDAYRRLVLPLNHEPWCTREINVHHHPSQPEDTKPNLNKV